MRSFLIAAMLCLLASAAHATAGGDHRYDNTNAIAPVKKAAKKAHRSHRAKHAKATRAASRPVIQGAVAQLLPHPVGCPTRAFCGCGAALEIFGRHVRELWLARAWFKFPSAAPAPGMVAVRRHHVFVIREVRGPGLVLAYDANSGGHRTRLHLRSLAGYRVVNPRSAQWAYSG